MKNKIWNHWLFGMLVLLMLAASVANAQTPAPTTSHANYNLDYSRVSYATPIMKPVEAADNNYSFPDENSVVDISSGFPKLILSQKTEDLNSLRTAGPADSNASFGMTFKKVGSAAGILPDKNKVSTEGFGANIKFCSNNPWKPTCPEAAAACNQITSVAPFQAFWIYREQQGVVHPGSFRTYDYTNFIDAIDPTGYDAMWGTKDQLEYDYQGNDPYYGGSAYRCTIESISLHNSPGEWQIVLGVYDNITKEYDDHTKEISMSKSRKCSIVPDSAWSSKNSYKCNDTITTSHRFLNNGTSPASFDIAYEVYDPEGLRIQTGSASGSLNPGNSFTGTVNSSPPGNGWHDYGYYKVRAHVLALCDSGEFEDQYTFTSAYVPVAPCQQGNIVAVSANPSKSSFACTEDLASSHEFKDTGSYDFTYNETTELFDPGGNKLGSGSKSGQVLGSGQSFTWNATSAIQNYGNWTKSGNYRHRVTLDGQFSNGVKKTVSSDAYMNVPTACVAGEINSYDGKPDKESYSCYGRILSTGHRFENTSNVYSFNYKAYYDLLDPNGNVVLASTGTENQVLAPGKSTDWEANPPAPAGGWQVPGKYTLRMWATGKFDDGRERTVYSYSRPYIPVAPCDQITGKDGRPTQSSYACDEAIKTENHIFTNTSTDKKFTYKFYSELYDPQGSKLWSWVSEEKTLGSNKFTNKWTETLAPTGGWPVPGTYTVKTWVNGKYPNGVERTAYSYAYAEVPKAPCEACKIVSDSAWVEQDGKCNDPIIVNHKFDNTGERTFPHNASFSLYDQSGNRMGTGSNSYSADPGKWFNWAIKWNVPAGGWKPGTYRSETYVDGMCTGGGTSSASNSVTATIPASCGDTTCAGTMNVSVNDGASNPITEAKVYLDGSHRTSTNSSGNASTQFSDSTCKRSHSIGIYCSDGTYCDTKSASISTNGDSTNLSFSCGVCARSQLLSVSASTTSNDSYSLNDTIKLEITVRDGAGNNGTGASLSIYNPFTGQTTRTTTSSNGTNTYTTTASKTGVQTFTITASKSGYNSASTSRNVAVNEQLATIYVSVANNDGTQLEGTYLYLDSTSSGTTDSSGKKTLSTTAGNHTIEAKCSSLEYCGSTSGYFSGQKNISFKCNCDIDVDGDGLTASEEEIIGSDPYNANSNLESTFAKHGIANSCLTPTIVIFNFASDTDRKRLAQNIGAMDYGQLSAAMSGKATALQATVQSTGITTSNRKTKAVTLKQFFEEYENTKALAARDGTVVVMANKESGATALNIVPPKCTGFFIGIFNGAYTGVKSDVEFIAGSPDMALEGMKWAVKNWREVIMLVIPPPFNILFGAGKVADFFANGTFIKLFNAVGGEIRAATMETLKEGATWNKNPKGSDDYSAFQVGFLHGSVTGFIAEQVGLIVVTDGIIGYAKAIKLTGKAAKLVDTAYKAYSKIFGKFGSKAAEALKELDVAYGLKTLEFTSEPARDFVIKSMEFFTKKEDWAKFWGTIGKTEQSATKGSVALQKLTTELGGEEATKKAMSKLMNSKYGKEALETFEEGPLQQLAEVYQKHDSLVVERFGQNLANKGYSLRDAMTYADDAKDISGVKNLRTNAVTSNNLGDFFNLKRASELKKQANTRVIEVGRKELVEFKYEGQTLSGELEMDLLYDVTFEGKTTRKIEEVKSSLSGVIELGKNEEQRTRQIKQIYKMAAGVKKGVAQEARLVSPVGQVFSEEYKKLAEQLGLTVVEGAI